jgi:hypothetical protein
VVAASSTLPKPIKALVLAGQSSTPARIYFIDDGVQAQPRAEN